MSYGSCNYSHDLFLCGNGNCVNVSLVCDGVDNCGDASDENATLIRCRGWTFQLTATVIAGIVIGCIIGTVILCCVFGTVLDCVLHIYKYWCSCLHKAYHYQTEIVALRTPITQSPSGDLVVTALPPSYSTVTLSRDTSSWRHEMYDGGGSEALPPSYSSIFRNDCVTYLAEANMRTIEAFLAPPR
ncbi:hypothetical protein LSAT2_017938 [Lamellibrachia satsuma]|nr:hypothetical protein LSAT2_017938 [Lamellibrachia satsuma]